MPTGKPPESRPTPTQRTAKSTPVVDPSVDEQTLAAQLFVKLYDPSNGRTAEHIADLAIAAAKTFIDVFHR